jgi:enamine deaminase RidA (YjgF/YER057c/UK114 family)
VEIEKKLNNLGFQLPRVPEPTANYISCVRVGNLLFIGGNTGRINGKRKFEGKVGEAVTLEQAYTMARDCALNHLAIIKAELGDLDRVERIVKVLAYINAAPGFTELRRWPTASRICSSICRAIAVGMRAPPWAFPLWAAMRQWRQKSLFRSATNSDGRCRQTQSSGLQCASTCTLL